MDANGALDRIHRASREAAREEFLKAKRLGSAHPVIVVCTLDIQRILRRGATDHAAEFWRALADETGEQGLALVLEDHAHLYEGLRTISPGAAKALGATPDPDKPFRIVVITGRAAKVFSDSAPE